MHPDLSRDKHQEVKCCFKRCIYPDRCREGPSQPQCRQEIRNGHGCDESQTKDAKSNKYVFGYAPTYHTIKLERGGPDNLWLYRGYVIWGFGVQQAGHSMSGRNRNTAFQLAGWKRNGKRMALCYPTSPTREYSVLPASPGLSYIWCRCRGREAFVTNIDRI